MPRYYMGQKVRALLRLVGEQPGQIVFQGDVGEVTALPGRNSNIDAGAVAEVRINGVRFDAQPDMIEPAQKSGSPSGAPRDERRRDPNDPKSQKTYTRAEFIAEYGEKKGQQVWKRSGEVCTRHVCVDNVTHGTRAEGCPEKELRPGEA